MATFELYSDRRKRELGEEPDVFVYDELPEKLRNQISYIVLDAIGPWYSRIGYENSLSRSVYSRIVKDLLRHTGRLVIAHADREDEQLANFIRRESDVHTWLDGVELCCRYITRLVGDYQWSAEPRLKPQEAIQDLNTRFMQNGVGYQFESGKLIRIDSKYLHTEVVKPTLALLQDARFEGANDEFLKAHEHYRNGEVKDCLTNALKALESTLKTICTNRKWPFDAAKDTAKKLINICFANGLVPTALQDHYTHLEETLISGVPVVRNKMGGHGQGTEVVEVPPHYAAYALHLTGSAIQFLIESEKKLP